MPGGIDIEPNNSAFTIEDIMIVNNYFEGVWGTGGAIGLVLLRDNAPGYNITIKDNRIVDCSCGILIDIFTEGSSDNLTIKGNIIDEKTKPFNFVGKGRSRNWIISGNEFSELKKQSIPGDIVVENLTVKNNRIIKTQKKIV